MDQFETYSPSAIQQALNSFKDFGSNVAQGIGNFAQNLAQPLPSTYNTGPVSQGLVGQIQQPQPQLPGGTSLGSDIFNYEANNAPLIPLLQGNPQETIRRISQQPFFQSINTMGQLGMKRQLTPQEQQQYNEAAQNVGLVASMSAPKGIGEGIPLHRGIDNAVEGQVVEPTQVQAPSQQSLIGEPQRLSPDVDMANIQAKEQAATTSEGGIVPFNNELQITKEAQELLQANKDKIQPPTLGGALAPQNWEAYKQAHPGFGNHTVNGPNSFDNLNGQFTMVSPDAQTIPSTRPMGIIDKDHIDKLIRNDVLTVLKPNGDGTYSMFDGNHDIRLARGLGFKQIPALVLGGDKPVAQAYEEAKAPQQAIVGQQQTGFDKIMERYARKLQAESGGQSILGSMVTRNISPQDTANKFWNETFPTISEYGKGKMIKELENHTGMKLGFNGTTLQNMVNNIDVGNDVNNLEGTERGFVSLMQYANDNIKKELPLSPQSLAQSYQKILPGQNPVESSSKESIPQGILQSGNFTDRYNQISNTAQSPVDLINGSNKLTNEVLNSGDIKAIKQYRATLNKSRFDLAGADTKAANFETQFAYMNNAKGDPTIGPMIDSIENQMQVLDQKIEQLQKPSQEQPLVPQKLAQSYQKILAEKPVIDQVSAQIAQDTGTEVTTRSKQPGSYVISAKVKGHEPVDGNAVNFTGQPQAIQQAEAEFKANPNVDIIKEENVVNTKTGYSGKHDDFVVKNSDQVNEAQFTTPDQRATQIVSHSEYKGGQAQKAKGQVEPEVKQTASAIRDSNPQAFPGAQLADQITDQEPKEVYYVLNNTPTPHDFGNPQDTTQVDKALEQSAKDNATKLDSYMKEKLPDVAARQKVESALAFGHPDNLNPTELNIYKQLEPIQKAVQDKLGSNYEPMDSLSDSVQLAIGKNVDNQAGGQAPNDYYNKQKDSYIPDDKRVNWLQKTVLPSVERWAVQGPAGKALKELWLKGIADAQVSVIRKLQMVEDALNLGRGNRNNQFENAWLSVEGKAQPVNEKVTQAATSLKAAMDVSQQEGIDSGSLKGTLPNYMPHSGYDFTGDKLERAIKNLIDSGQVVNRAQALGLINRLQNFQRTARGRTFGNFDFQRQFDVPGYDISKGALKDYLWRSSYTSAMDKVLGTNDENAMKLIDQMPDKDDALRVFNQLSGKTPYDPMVMKISSAVKGITAFLDFSRGALSHVYQIANTLAKAAEMGGATGGNPITATAGGVEGVIRSLFQLPGTIYSSNVQTQAIKMGVNLQSILAQEAVGGVKGNWLGKAVAPLARQLYKANATWASLTGQDQLRRWGEQASDGNEKAIFQLNKHGLNGQAIADRGGTLTDDELLGASLGIGRGTVGDYSAEAMPLWMKSPIGSTIMLGRAPEYFQAKMAYRTALDGIKQGNFLPLAILILGTAVIGEKAEELRQWIENKKVDSALALKEAALKGTGAGLISGIFPAYQGEDKAHLMAQEIGAVGGPVAGLVATTGLNTLDALGGNIKPLIKQGLSAIPVGGIALKNYIFAYNPSADTQKYLDEKATGVKALSDKQDAKALQMFNTYTTSQAKGGPDSTQKNEMLIKAMVSKEPVDQKFVDTVYTLEHNANPNDPLWSQSEQFVKDYTAWRVASATGKSADAANLALKYATTDTPLPVIQRKYQEYIIATQQKQYDQQQATINQQGAFGGMIPNPYQIQQTMGVAPQLNATQPTALGPETPIQKLARTDPALAAKVEAYTAAGGQGDITTKYALLAQSGAQMKNFWDQQAKFYKDPANTANIPQSPLDQYLVSQGIAPSVQGGGAGGKGSSFIRMPRAGNNALTRMIAKRPKAPTVKKLSVGGKKSLSLGATSTFKPITLASRNSARSGLKLRQSSPTSIKLPTFARLGMPTSQRKRYPMRLGGQYA